MKNILLIVPKYVKRGEQYHFPLGLAYISSYLKSKQFPVFNLNLCHSNEPIKDQVTKAIRKYGIQIIATGGISFWWNEICEIVDICKNFDSSLTTIVGGAIVTSDPDLIMNNMKIDFGIIGEGEITMAELCTALNEGLPFTDISGLIFWNKEHQLTKSKQRNPIMDLDSLPFPDYEGFELNQLLDIIEKSEEKYLGAMDNPRPVEIIASRSCPYNCTFCYHPLGHKYRQRSIEKVFQEISLLVHNYRINIVNFLDELFSVNKKRIFAFADKIKNLSIFWTANFRVSDVNEVLIKKIKECNALFIFFGIESLSNKILESMHKSITREEIEPALKLSYDANLTALGHIILGDPQETMQTARESINWWKNHPQYRIELNFILAIPDSPIYRYAIAHKIIKNKLDHIKKRFPVVNLTRMSDRQFDKIRREVNYYNYTLKYMCEGKVLGTKHISSNTSGPVEYLFDVQCPFCKHRTRFKQKVSFHHPYIQLICRKCIRVMKLRRNQIFYEEYSQFTRILREKIEYLFNIIYIKSGVIKTILSGTKSLLHGLRMERLTVKSKQLIRLSAQIR